MYFARAIIALCSRFFSTRMNLEAVQDSVGYYLRLIVRLHLTFLFACRVNGTFPPLRLVIINGVKNEIANVSVTSALKTLREKFPGYLGHVWTVQMNETDASEIIDNVCHSWSSAISQGGSTVPDLVLDVSMSGTNAEISSSITAALGLPTLSAQYGQEDDIQYWRNLDVDQRNYLIQVLWLAVRA